MPNSRSGRHAPGQVRIGGGLWKRTPLQVADVDGLRPTPDRVRETLFNWLGQRLDGLCCLDPFAGSGVLGLEAASRGASRVVMIERDARAAAAIRAVIDRLKATQVELHVADALRWLASSPAGSAATGATGSSAATSVAGVARESADGALRDTFDLVFLDPPFGQQWLDRVLPLLAPRLSEVAHLYIEDAAEVTVARVSNALAIGGLAPQVEGLRADKAGQVHYHLFAIRQSNKNRRGEDTW